MYLYTLELPKRESPKGHPTVVEGGRTYMVQVLPHTRSHRWLGASACVCVGLGLGLLILNFLNNVSLKPFGLQSVGLGRLAL